MTAPYSRASAIGFGEAQASQVTLRYGASVVGGSPSFLSQEEVRWIRTEFADVYDSYWGRDPGRANGPYS